MAYFLYWTYGTQEMDSFFNELKKCHPYLSSTYETSKENVNFQDLIVVILRNVATTTDF